MPFVVAVGDHEVKEATFYHDDAKAYATAREAQADYGHAAHVEVWGFHRGRLVRLWPLSGTGELTELPLPH